MLSLRTDLPEDRIQVSENQKTYEIRPSDPRIGRLRHHHFLVIFATQGYRVSLRRFLQTRSNWSKATTNFSPVSSIRRSRYVRKYFVPFSSVKKQRCFLFNRSATKYNSFECYFSTSRLWEEIERIWLIFFHRRAFHLGSIVWWNFSKKKKKKCKNYKNKWRIVARSPTG